MSPPPPPLLLLLLFLFFLQFIFICLMGLVFTPAGVPYLGTHTRALGSWARPPASGNA